MIYQSETGNIRMSLAGEVMPTRRLSPFGEPDYLALVEITRNADVSFTNLETTVRNRDEGNPRFTRGTPMITPPRLLDELKWMGFNLVSTANNHAVDFGTGGVMATIRHLKAADLAFAGTGSNLAEATAPCYLDTPAGRVALIAATSTFKSGEEAADQRSDHGGRPGVNVLRHAVTYEVDEVSIAALDAISRKLGFTQERVRDRASFYSASEVPEEAIGRVNFLGANFRSSDRFHFSSKINWQDAERNIRWIKEARRQADWVVFSFHYHEYGAAGGLTAGHETELAEPADFVREFSRLAIDAGADVVAGHGMHVTLGIEIYKHRPIFYSLGNHILQNDTIEVLPTEAYGRFDLGANATPADFLDARTGKGTRGYPAVRDYWESMVAVCDFEGGKLSGIKIYPVDLGFGRSRSQQGRPVLARDEVARHVLDRIIEMTMRYGTEILMDGEMAVVKL